MRHEFTLRLRIPRPKARALLTAALLSAPVTLVCPSIQQSATLTLFVPNGDPSGTATVGSANAAFNALTTNGHTVLGKGSAAVSLIPESCALTNPNKPYGCTPSQNCPQRVGESAPPPTIPVTSCNPLRKLYVQSQYDRTGSPNADPPANALYGDGTGGNNWPILMADGDIAVDRLCFWSNTNCATFWPMEWGDFQYSGCSDTGGDTTSQSNCSESYNKTGTNMVTMHWSVPSSTYSTNTAFIFTNSVAYPDGTTHNIPLPNPDVKTTVSADPCSSATSDGTWTAMAANGNGGSCNDVTSVYCKLVYPTAGSQNPFTGGTYNPFDTIGCCQISFGNPGLNAAVCPFSPSVTCVEKSATSTPALGPPWNNPTKYQQAVEGTAGCNAGSKLPCWPACPTTTISG